MHGNRVLLAALAVLVVAPVATAHVVTPGSGVRAIAPGQVAFPPEPRLEAPSFLVSLEGIFVSQPSAGSALDATRPVVVSGRVDLLQGRITTGRSARVSLLDAAGNDLQGVSTSLRCSSNCDGGTGGGTWSFGPVTTVGDPDPATAKVRVTVPVDGPSGPRTLTRDIAFATPTESFPDLEPLGMEATQGVQPAIASITEHAPGPLVASAPGLIPLVAGKSTIVRVPVTAARSARHDVAGVTGRLSGSLDGRAFAEVLAPVAPAVATAFPAGGGQLATEAVARREGPALTFRLPPFWVSRPGQLHLEFEVNGNAVPPGERIRECDGCKHPGDIMVLTIPVITAPATRVLLDAWEFEDLGAPVGQPRRGGSITSRWTRAERLLPLPDGAFEATGFHQPIRTSTRDCGRLLDLLQQAAIQDPGIGIPVASIPANGRMCTVGSFSAAGISRLNVSAIARLDDDGSTLAHEMFHVFGLSHSSCDHGENDGGGCDPTGSGPHGMLGGMGVDVDLLETKAIGTTAGFHTHDVLTYGGPRWVGVQSWQRTSARLRVLARNGVVTAANRTAARADASGLAITGPLVGDRLVVSAGVDAAGHGRIGPVVPAVAAAADGSDRSAGAFVLRALDAGGVVVGERRFDRSPETTHAPAEATITTTFDGASAIAGLVLADSTGTELARVDRSAGGPTVHWTDPAQPRPPGPDDLLKVAWTASDPDADPLRYVVQFSPDDGKTWQVLQPDVEGLTTVVDISRVAATRRGRFRVLGSDGLRAGVDTADRTIVIPQHRPEVTAAAPGSIALADGGLDVLAVAVDAEDGRLGARRLRWRSDRDGALPAHAGVPETRGLSIGTHRLTVRALDSSGRSRSASVRVTIVRRASADHRRPRLTRIRRSGPRRLTLAFSAVVVGAGPRGLAIRDRSGRLPATAVVRSADGHSLRVTLARRARGRAVVAARRTLTDVAGRRVR
ncbi:MAG: hypothetical protein ACJ762_07020 [Solirubrobacteraceae bacterium]